MIPYFVTNTDNDVTSIGEAPTLSVVPIFAGETVHEGVAELHAKYNPTTQQLTANSTTAADRQAREQRGMLLAWSGAMLAELLLPDSYPKLSAAAKQAKIDVFIKYRQALRDITNQPNPANITWPTPPGAI